MTDKLPDWAVEMAREVETWWSNDGRSTSTRDLLQGRIALALVEAERRGIERAAKVADEAAEMRLRLFKENDASINAHKCVQAEDIAATIRKLGESK